MSRKLTISFDGDPHGTICNRGGELHIEGPHPHAVWHHAEAAARNLIHASPDRAPTPDEILAHLADTLQGRTHAHWVTDAD